ncbi:MAG: LysR family transcriptional regulator [Paracoccaceae bacterium]
MDKEGAMRLNWDDMRTVLALVRTGTLASAAQELDVAYTTVARRVARAEAALGTELFQRQADGYHPNAQAQDLARAAERMEEEEHNALRRLAGQDQTLAGPLTVTIPQLLIQTYLAAVLADFTRRYPQIDLVVSASNDLLDLNRREADVAIRISADPGDTLVSKRLTEQRSGCFARPDLVAVAKADPQAGLDWVLYSHHPQPPKPALAVYPNPRVRGRFDDMVALIAAAQAGMGALRMPLFLGRATRGLVPLETIPTQSYAPIWILSHRDLRSAARVTAFKSCIEPWFRANAELFV